MSFFRFCGVSLESGLFFSVNLSMVDVLPYCAWFFALYFSCSSLFIFCFFLQFSALCAIMFLLGTLLHKIFFEKGGKMRE